MQAMGSLCHEVAKLQADRAQLEDLLAQVLLSYTSLHLPSCLSWAKSASPDSCSHQSVSMLAERCEPLG